MFSKRRFSGRAASLAAGIILFFNFNIISQPAVDGNLPGWVLYEKGLAYFEQGRLDLALEYFNLSAKSGNLTPEATYYIGQIYEQEGDYLLAEKQYEQAMEDSRFLYIPDQKWDIFYSLAGIYLNRGEFDRYEQMLLSVFDEELVRNEQTIRTEHAYVQMLKEDGMDKFLLLFRLKLTFSLESASQLGVYYAGNGEVKRSLIKNLYTVLSLFTSCIDYLMEKDPEFSFPVDREEILERDGEFLAELYENYTSTIDPAFRFHRDLKTLALVSPEEDMEKAEQIIRSRMEFFSMSPTLYVLRKMETLEGLYQILDDERLYRAMYYLGRALYDEGFEERARDLWTLGALSSRENRWNLLCVKALDEPEYIPPSLIY